MPFRFVILFLVACCLVSSAAWSGPAAPIEIETTQPDGTTFIAVPRGDEFANWTETRSGHSIVKKNGTWYYAEKDSAGNLRASNNAVGSLSSEQLQAWPKHLAPDTDPSDYDRGKVRDASRPAQTGDFNGDQSLGAQTQHVLTILVDYSDVSFTYSDASFQTLMFGATNSVKEFYEENSYGNFTVAPAAESEGTANDGIVHVARGITHPDLGQADWRSEAREIVALANTSVDFAAFDTSGEGIVSADELSIVIILAGYETSYGGNAFAKTPNVWGHASGFSPLTLDGVDLSPYTMFGETHGHINFPGDDHQATIGIMCHELGHLMFNLPDLYDTDQSSAGIGDWGLMAGGSWNFAAGDTWVGESPAHMVAWSKTQVGFTVPDLVESFQAGVAFPNAGANSSARMIWIDKYRTANGEYILLENRQMTGYDAGLPGAGLMIWHVDQGVRGNANEMRKLVDLEEADGLAELDASPSDGGDDGDPYPGSTNNTLYDDTSNPDSKANTGATTGIAVNNISASMATMTADLQPPAGPVGDHVRYDEDGPDVSIPIAQTVRIGSHMLNDTSMDTLDGVDVFINDPTGATVDVFLYESMLGGVPANLLHSQTNLDVGPLWQRILLATPQGFPAAEERGIVVRIANDSSNSALSWELNGDISGRSFFDVEDDGTFTAMTNCASICGDVGLVALLSGSPTGPSATAIVPATTGPTNADSVAFDVTFDTDVVNFNDAADVVINHTGTAHGGVNISGAGASYTATVTGITGDGSFTLAVDTTSDVEDNVGSPLESSVTSDAVNIDNTPPAIGISSPSAGTTAGGPVSYTISYTGADAVTLVEADITLNQTGDADGSLAVSGAGASSRTVTISGITGNGTLGISIAAGTASDTAGNSAPAAGPSETFVVENLPPAPEFDSTPVPGSVLAFGEVELGATSGELSVMVDNFGTADLTLSCNITGANADQFNLVACPTPVAAEGSVNLSVTCSPDSSGEKTASLDVTTNDADEANPSYPLTCTGVEGSPDVIHDHGFEDSDAPGA